MLRKSFVLMVMGTVMFFLCSISSADVPDSINYQGKLTTASGGCLNDTVQMTFTIYADAFGTTAEWTETQTAVEVKEGIFSVHLGSISPLPALIFDGSAKYLGVQVESDPEMSPLKPMVTTAYAFHCATADSALNAPAAGIVSVDGVSNPGGDVDLIQQDAITISPNDGANTITFGETHSARTDDPHQVTAAQSGALVAVDGVSNAGGNVDFIAGSNMTITPNDGANTVTFSSTAGGIGGSGTTNYIPKFTASTTLGNSAISQSGNNVGIGTTNPLAMLHVRSGSGTGSIRVESSTGVKGGFNTYNTYSRIGTDTNHEFLLMSNGTGRLWVKTDGKIGIGTASPAYALHVNGNFFANTVNTGLGNYELYAMNQNVRTSDNPTFNRVHLSDYGTALGGFHVGGTSDPGTDNLVVDGTGNFDDGIKTGDAASGDGIRFGKKYSYAADINPIVTCYSGYVWWDYSEKKLKVTETNAYNNHCHAAGYRDQGAVNDFYDTWIISGATVTVATLTVNGNWATFEITSEGPNAGYIHIHCFYSNSKLVAHYWYRYQ